MAAAAASVPVRLLDDITECPICAEQLTDARVLPCVHTFCLKCLQGYVKNARAGDKRDCPLCRQVFTVPLQGGLANLPRNYFVDKVLEVKSMANRLALSSNLICDLCREEADRVGTKTERKAAMFCTDCNQNMCKECNRYHQKFKANNSHRLIDLEKQHTIEELSLKLPENLCDVHTQKPLELYCLECKVVLCMMCYVEAQHGSHKCSNVETVARELKSTIQSDIDELVAKDEEWNKIATKVVADQANFEARASQYEKDVNERADHIKQVAESYRNQLLNKLKIARKNQTLQTETTKGEIQRQSVVLKNFVKYMNELKQKGTACDIAKEARSLHTRTAELCKLDFENDLASRYSTTNVNFASASDDEEIKRIFGQLDIEVSKGGSLHFTVIIIYLGVRYV